MQLNQSKLMLEKAMALIDEIFNEVAVQYLYLKSQNAITDRRLTSYVKFVNELVKSFSPRETFTSALVAARIESLHFKILENSLFKRDTQYQNSDCKWILIQIEKRLLGSSAIYEKIWTDLDAQERNAENLLETLAVLATTQPPLQKASIWEIKGHKYMVGTSFALNTDIWLRSISDINSPVQFSRRLSDFSPLEPEDFKHIFIALEC